MTLARRGVKPWRAPLVHFLLLGGALFALRGAVSGDAGQARRVLVVPAAELARIESEALRQTGRAPGAAELDARVAAWVD